MIVMSDTDSTEAQYEEDGSTVDADPNPDLILSIRLKHLFSRFAEGQDEILRLSSFMERRGTELDDLTSRVREKIELYLDEDVDVAALEDLIAHITRRDESEGGPDWADAPDEESIRDLESVLDALPRGHASSYLDGIIRAMGSPPSDQVLRSSLLVSLVGELEIYVNQLLRACFDHVPSAVDNSKASFMWSEIAAFSSLDEFRDSVTEKAVERALHGSLPDWLDFFEAKFNVKVDASARKPAVTEIFQRRHCIVHNGGSVSPQYIHKTKGGRGAVEVGDSLNVTPSYLVWAADELYGVAMSLGWSVAHKLIGEEDLREDVRSAFVNSIYHLLGDRRYGLARDLSERLPSQHLSFDQSLIVQVNKWLAYKLDGKFDEVRADVESFRTESLSRRFTMARHALLDEHEPAYRIASAMLAESDEQFPLSHYLTWPLLRDVRRWARDNGTHESLPGAGVGQTVMVASCDSPPRKDES